MPVQLRIGPKLMLALAGLPAVDERIEALRQSYAAEPDVKPAELERLSDGWADFSGWSGPASTRRTRPRSRR